jgi:hypothetical protein
LVGLSAATDFQGLHSYICALVTAHSSGFSSIRPEDQESLSSKVKAIAVRLSSQRPSPHAS